MKIRNPQDVQNTFMRTLNMVKNPKPFMLMIVGEKGDKRPWTIRGAISKAFVEKRDPVSGYNWAPLQIATLRQKERLYGSSKATLIATGNLFNSLMGGTGNVFVVQGKKLIYGTTFTYGAFHMTGTKHVPPRRFMGISKQQAQKIKTLFSQYIKQAWYGERSEGPKK